MQIELTLNDMVFGGDAIGRLPDGRAVFVPFGLPGEKVLITLVEDKRSFARGRIDRVLEASPMRIQPRCRHFGLCGGCNYQHIGYKDQLEIKRGIICQQLQRLAGLADFPVADVVPSPDKWNYRNTVQFHVSPDGKLGYQAAASNKHVEISECFLPLEGISELWPQLTFEPGSGIERLMLRQGIEGDLIMGLESCSDTPPEFTVDFPISAVFRGPNAEYVLSGEDVVLMQVKDRDFRVSIGSFFQANLPQAKAMVELVLNLAGDLSGKTVLDGYCGVGLFSAFLAAKAQHLIAIESSESSCSDFAVNLDEFENVELYIDQVENVLPSLGLKLDIAVVDPPRAGLDKRVISALDKANTHQIVYVSCDPATLARDVKRLIALGYELKRMTPFDQFPQTYHIETISLFEKAE